MRRRCYLLLPLILGMVFAAGATAAAQVPGLPSAHPANALAPGVRVQGRFVTAPISVDGVQLFRVAALASPPPGALPIDTRAFLVQNAIGQILALEPDSNATVFSPKTLRVSVERLGSEWALVASDVRHVSPIPIVTVTSQDAQLAGLTERDLATQWQQTLEPALVAALVKRQPSEIRANAELAARGAIALAILTIVAIGTFVFFRQRVRAIAEWILVLLVLVWVAAVTAGMLLFPQTAAIGQYVMRAAGRVAAIWIGAVILDRVLDFVIDRGAHLYASRKPSGVERARLLLRAPTVSRAINGLKSFVVYFVALLATLSALSIPIASVVTVGGIAALAIGFAAQTLVRDWLNGMLVLIEDQYVVGDYVLIGDYNGIVEALTLRAVQIRDAVGNLITIPHSAVTQVANASRVWARIDYRVAVDPATDLASALTTLRETIEAMAKDERWSASFIEPIETIGVEALTKFGTVLRVSIRTAPLRQFELRRAINAQILERFGSAGIKLGIDPLSPVSFAPPASPDPA